jgi:SAM-dependent methyltransferase
MNNKKDAYGQEVWAYFNGKESYEVVERDDGFVGLSSGAKAYFAEFGDWPKHQQQGIKFAKGRVLDVGAGAGRVALYLQKNGHKVTAIDNSPLAVKVCKKRGLKDARVLPIERIDFFKPNTFDSVVMYGNNFGLFGNPKKAKSLLKKFHRITTPDALIIAESNDPYKTDDPVHLSYHKLNRRRGRMAGQLKIRIRFRNFISDWFDYLLVSKEEMESILKNTGWKVRKFIDSEKFMYIAIIEKE